MDERAKFKLKLLQSILCIKPGMVRNWQLQGEGCIPNRNSTTTALH